MPQGLRHRVRNYEQHHWIATRGIDEGDVIRSLPEDLRREIKYYLCLDLVREVNTDLTCDTYIYIYIYRERERERERVKKVYQSETN